MSETPLLTDRAALSRHRARASSAPALFLHEEARADIEDRLSLVNKSFRDAAIVTPFAEVWRDAFPAAKIIPDAEMLDLDEAAHDLVIHAMALHWANDPVGQLIQCRRALIPDGLLLAASFGGQTLHELRAAMGQAEIEITGGLSPRVAPMAEIRDLGALLQRAGLALPVADSAVLTASYPSALHLMRDLRAMGEANALSARLRAPTRRGVLLRAAELYAEAYGDAGGRVPATFELITLTGWAPDASQPQPLRPGSAAARLADALGATETPLKD
ncbi:methyltransferase domain-containing protein [Marivita sp. GX14005]|uniref:methyltransferase domain-containing protein n=1 Tax=Marivita sp. GX14005 TaxID=2942276 RepID=UPI00201980EF|nr:methyltransferase domain-containing protein [Marivita sp. GX14005]MCL3881607.1 methyltransferase domain-containing protein [Marivita sp. GX14005]